MKLLRKTFSFVLLLITLLSILPFTVFGSGSNVEYTGNTGDFIFDGDGKSSLTDLFSEFKSVVPGDEIKQTITLKNNADKSVKVKFYIRCIGIEDDATVELLNKLQLTVRKIGDTPFFDAPADTAGTLSDWVSLGLLYSGGTADIELTLSVPTELDDTYENKIGKIKWQFMAIEMDAGDSPWTCDECGSHTYRIIDYDGYSEYLCENCGHSEYMLCEICHGKMHKVIYRTEDRKVWYYYVCENDATHHTQPAPQTGDSSHIVTVSVIALISILIIFFIIIFFIKRRKNNEKEAV